jgi:hypothetical protein
MYERYERINCFIRFLKYQCETFKVIDSCLSSDSTMHFAMYSALFHIRLYLSVFHLLIYPISLCIAVTISFSQAILNPTEKPTDKTYWQSMSSYEQLVNDGEF